MMANGIPAPLDTDDDDVAWALQTAQVQWKRGSVADAIVWLRRAVDAAIASGRSQRATELNGVAADLTEAMLAQAAAGTQEAQSPADSVDELLGGHGPVGRATIDVEFDELTEVASEPSNPFEQAVLPENNPFSQAPVAAPWDPPSPPPPRHPAESITSIMNEPLSAVPIESAQVVSSAPYSDAEPVMSSELESDPGSVAQVSVSDLIVDPPLPPEDHVDAPTEISRFPSDLLPPPDQSATAPPPLPSFEASEPPVPPSYVPPPPSAPPPASFPPVVAPAAPASEPPAAPPVAPASAPPVAEEEADAVANVEGVPLEQVAGLEDLPPEAQQAFAARARVEVLDIDEEVNQFAVALVLDGWVAIMPAIADAAAAHAGKGEVVFTAGSMQSGVALRVVAVESDTRVAVWDAEALEEATGDCPWVADELRAVADRFQALAGAAMGPLGDRLDDSLRAEVTKRCSVRRLLPGDVFVEVGHELPGMHIVGVGSVELVDAEGQRLDELGPGDFLFASEVMSHGTAPATARAGEDGALILFAERMAAHELLVSVPPLLEILAS